MGSRGPKPGPTQLKLLKGTEERYINRDEPAPNDQDAILPPEGMTEGALEVWNDLAPDLIDKFCLTAWDVHTFAVFCEATHRFRFANKMMGDELTGRGSGGGVIKSPYWQIMRDCAEIMAKYSGKFGLTPGDRAGLQIDKTDQTSKQGAERILS
jgi:P27 family predicted phage terminase small subunit